MHALEGQRFSPLWVGKSHIMSLIAIVPTRARAWGMVKAEKPGLVISPCGVWNQRRCKYSARSLNEMLC